MTNDFLSQFPTLFAPVFWEWGPIHAQFESLDAPPPEHLISNINVLGHVGDQWVIIRLADGSWEITGGTLEPGESYLEAAQREMLEEAGAKLLNLHIVGAWKCRSEAPKPYRPHLPHPDFYRLLCYGEVELAAQPSNPPDAEQVASIELASLDEVARRLRSIGRDDLAESYLFAAWVKNRAKPG